MSKQPDSLLQMQLLTLLKELHGTALRASLKEEDTEKSVMMTELAEQAYLFQQKLVGQD